MAPERAASGSATHPKRAFGTGRGSRNPAAAGDLTAIMFLGRGRRRRTIHGDTGDDLCQPALDITGPEMQTGHGDVRAALHGFGNLLVDDQFGVEVGKVNDL